MALAELGRFNRIEAHVVAGALEAAGIPAVSFDAEMSLGEGSAFLIPVRVMVDADDLAEARAVLAEASGD
ncbi:DUF2007 domain-containing protein [Sphingomonas sp. IW22]|uniref:putative signal transducing protein n=1 Tax=Sphingomonas sp. IW22 TaxID=3242489 RepID=UPI0035225E44